MGKRGGYILQHWNVIKFVFVLAITLSILTWIKPFFLPEHQTHSDAIIRRRAPSAASSSSSLPAHPILDLQATSSVHGWVKKTGHATLRSWDSSEDQPRRDSWADFLQKRASGKIPLTQSYPSVPPHGPDPWGCRLYFNHAYKAMFIRTAKTGSTTIIESIFPPCLYNSEVAHCMERVADSNMTSDQVIELWEKYTVFTFTRNVWTRAISQYQYLVHFVKDRSECHRVTWDEFCEDPLAIGNLCRNNEECCTKKWTHQDWHMRQQTSCFLTDDGHWAADFIGRLERFDDDLIELFKVLNKKRNKGVPPLEHKPAPPANFNPLECKDQLGSTPNKESSSEKEADFHQNRHTSRRMVGAFDTIEGNQLPDVAYCDKNKFYTGRHAACFAAMTEFFATDISLLHANLSFAGGGAKE